MMQTESEMWAALEKTAENGQVVSSTPIGPYDPNAMYDRGWENLSYFGLPGGMYGGLGAGFSLALQCADVKARDLSMADLLLYRRNRRSWELVEPAKNSRIASIAKKLLTRPNKSAMTWGELMYMTTVHLETAQNAYIYTPRNLEGDILEYIPIRPAMCRMRISTNGNIFYEIFAGTEFDVAMLRDNYLVVPEREVIHFRGRLLDGVNGLSSMALGSPIFNLFDAISRYQTKLFGNDGRQPIVFERDQAFPNSTEGNTAFARLKDQLREMARRSGDSGEAMLLEAGLKAKAIAINSKDAATPESYTQQVHRICGLMNTPPHRIFQIESVAYNNMSQMERNYYHTSLKPLARNIQSKMRNHILNEEEYSNYSLEFDQGALISNDPETLEKLLKTGIMNGIITFNEGREIFPFRLGSLKKGGDHRMVPVAMALLDENGEVIQAALGQNPTQPGAGEDESPDNNAGRESDDNEDDAAKVIRLPSRTGA